MLNLPQKQEKELLLNILEMKIENLSQDARNPYAPINN